nr:MAG TPA: hypothetical protein [Bacteriophage sp.]
MTIYKKNNEPIYKFNHETLNGFSNKVRSLRYNLRIVRIARKDQYPN